MTLQFFFFFFKSLSFFFLFTTCSLSFDIIRKNERKSIKKTTDKTDKTTDRIIFSFSCQNIPSSHDFKQLDISINAILMSCTSHSSWFVYVHRLFYSETCTNLTTRNMLLGNMPNFYMLFSHYLSTSPLSLIRFFFIKWWSDKYLAMLTSFSSICINFQQR